MAQRQPGPPARERRGLLPGGIQGIRSARHEVIIETFIVFEDKVGLELQAPLIEAGRRGVQVDVLDPLSLAPLYLEANVIVRDRAFADCLRSRLQHLIDHGCRPARVPPPSRWSFWPQLRSARVFHFLRHFATWADYLPCHALKLKVAQPSTACDAVRRGRSDAESMEGAHGH